MAGKYGQRYGHKMTKKWQKILPKKFPKNGNKIWQKKAKNIAKIMDKKWPKIWPKNGQKIWPKIWLKMAKKYGERWPKICYFGQTYCRIFGLKKYGFSLNYP